MPEHRRARPVDRVTQAAEQKQQPDAGERDQVERDDHRRPVTPVFPGGTKEQYAYLGELMGEGVANQPERRLLAAGPSDGGWTILQVWDTQEALERFIADHLRPAMEQAGGRGYPEPPLITDIELTDLYT